MPPHHVPKAANVAFASDEALVAALRRGHPEARAAFFDRYHEMARRILVHVLGPDPEGTDVLHDAFIHAFQSVHTVRDAGALRAWFARVTVLTARKVLRSRKRRSWLRLFTSDEQERLHEPLAPCDAEAVRALRAAYDLLDRLSVDERVVFGLHYVEGMALPEVAEACGVSLATVKRRLRRARERFTADAANHPALVGWVRGETR